MLWGQVPSCCCVALIVTDCGRCGSRVQCGNPVAGNPVHFGAMRIAVICGALALLCLTLVGVMSCSAGISGSETLSHGRFHAVHVFKPKSEVRRFALLFSGDGGWDDGLGDIAESVIPSAVT